MPDSDRSKPSFSLGRRGLIWLTTFLGVAAVLAIIVMANYVAEGHFWRFQMDRNSAFKLSPQTKRILTDLTNDVTVTIFFQPHGKNEQIYSLASGLLAEYQNANPRHIQVKTLDYTREDGAAKELLSKYGLNALKENDFVMFQNDGHTKIVYAREMADYDFSDLLAGRSQYVRRSAFRGEVYFTSDIYSVTHPQTMKAYFLYGDGENDPDDTRDQSGYSKLAGILQTEIGCDWQKLTLQGTNTVPADCQLLIIPVSAHEGRFSAEELGKIAVYLTHGGRLLALLTVYSGLETVLADWGVAVGTSRVVETDKKYVVGDLKFFTAQLTPHPIMNALASEEMSICMVYPRPVGKIESQSKIPGGPEVTLLAFTSESGLDGNKQVGTFPLIVSVEQGGIQGVNSPHAGGTRIVVAGDSDFLDDQVIDSWPGNHSFAKQALNWLLERPQLMLSGLEPHPIKEYRLYMTDAQMQALRWLFLGGLPGIILLLGGLVWLRRRS